MHASPSDTADSCGESVGRTPISEIAPGHDFHAARSESGHLTPEVWALTEVIVEAVQRISDQEIRFVISTQVHPDHIGGNENLAGLGALIVAHDNVPMWMPRELRIPRRGGASVSGSPAHTDGESFVYFPGSDVLHTGDIFRTNMYPIIDVYNGGSIPGMIDALEIAIGLSGPNTKVIPGHGRGFSDRAGLIEVLVMMLDLREDISRLVAQGMTLDEVLAANPPVEDDEKWGSSRRGTRTIWYP